MDISDCTVISNNIYGDFPRFINSLGTEGEAGLIAKGWTKSDVNNSKYLESKRSVIIDGHPKLTPLATEQR